LLFTSKAEAIYAQNNRNDQNQEESRSEKKIFGKEICNMLVVFLLKVEDLVMDK